jgi:hypothetical protein
MRILSSITVASATTPGSMMAQYDPSWICRLKGVAINDTANLTCAEYCAFECPICEGCPNMTDGLKALLAPTDPFRSSATKAWLQSDLHPPK